MWSSGWRNRKAVEVVRYGGFQYRVDAHGTLDAQQLGEVMALASEAVLGSVLPTDLVPASWQANTATRSVGWSTSAGGGCQMPNPRSFARS